MKNKLLVTVNHFGRIPPLYQDGPIRHPIWIDVQTALTLVSCHYKVFEHNPNKPSVNIQLTLDNVTKDNFPPFIPTVKEEPRDGGSPVEVTKSVNLPKPDRVKEVSVVETPASIPVPEVSPVATSEKEENLESNIDYAIDSTVEHVSSEETENGKAPTQMSLSERAAVLGIDTTGMSRNKIRAAIREKENQK